jgi:predicted dehydrogenase
MNTLLETPAAPSARETKRRARLGFLGAGWIGLNRLEAVAQSGLAEITAIAEPSAEMLRKAGCLAPAAGLVSSLEEFSEFDLDGVVIATPSALHAEQARWAFERGLAVFCQKPLGRTRAENEEVIAAARKANRLLGVDLSYRHLQATQNVHEIVQSGALGKIFAIEMIFHNAYGPDKAWFYDRRLSGGGCVIDLGIHLVDLALWWLDFPKVVAVESTLFRNGARLASNEIEDYASARIDLGNGALLKVDCSWKLNAGCDAVISGAVYGSNGGVGFRNINGSFFDFVAEHYEGRDRRVLAEPPDAWGGRAILSWVERLSENPNFSHEVEKLVEVAGTLDQIYERARA